MTREDVGTRTIGLGGATSIGLGAIVGGGILALAGVAFAEAGPGAILAFLFNGLIAGLTALSFAEMSSAFPENGGAYAFTRKVLSVRSAFAVGWVLLFASIAAAALYALGFASYAIEAVVEAFHTTGHPVPAVLKGPRPGMVLSVAAVLFYSVLLTRKGGGNGHWETVGKIVLLAIIVAGGAFALVRTEGNIVQTRLQPFLPRGMKGVVSAMGFTFIALQGFDIIAAVGGDVKRPRYVLPRAMIGSLGIALALYIPLLFVVATVGVADGEHIRTLADQNQETLIALAVRRFLGTPGYWMVLIAAILAMLSALSANLLAASRIAFAMARDRTLPRALAVTSGERGVPVRAVALTGIVVVLLLVATRDVAAAGAAASLIFLLSFALTHVTAFLARHRGAHVPGAFRTPWFPFVPVVGLVSCMALALFQGVQVPSAGGVATLWLAAGFVLYFTGLSERAEVVDARTMAVDPDLARLRGRSPLVLVPLANPRRARALVEVGDALSVPDVGRVLLLSVVTADSTVTDGLTVAVDASQSVLREAMMAAADAKVRAEALVTFGPDPWSEIARVATHYQCEGLLLGLGAVKDPNTPSPLERLLEHLACDVYVLASRPEWTLHREQKVLVPVAGGGGHDEVRARLLASLVREGLTSVTFLRVVPESLSDVELNRLRRELEQEAEDEVPVPPEVLLLRSDDPVATILDAVLAYEVVVVGMQRTGKKRIIGRTARQIADAAPGATILISHRTPSVRLPLPAR